MNEFIDLMDIDIKYHKFDKYNEHQESFHHVYIDKCGNDALIMILEQVKASIPTYLYHSSVRDKPLHVAKALSAEEMAKFKSFMFADGTWAIKELSAGFVTLIKVSEDELTHFPSIKSFL